MNENNIVKDERENTMALNAESIKELWSKTYNTEGKPDWSHILPYYDKDVIFRDSIQEIRGIDDFKAMTERLTKRSKDLKMNVVKSFMHENDIFVEWEMTISFKKRPSSIMYGPFLLSLISISITPFEILNFSMSFLIIFLILLMSRVLISNGTT